MQLTVLGTATPYPRPDEPCSGYLLRGGTDGSAAGSRTTLWIDAGTGTLAELQRHITLSELDAIWISHRHADHSADLLVAYYALRFADPVLRPVAPIPLIGPESLLERLAAFLGPNAVDELPRVFDFRPMSGFGDARFGDLELSWGPVQHGVPAFGLTVDERQTTGGTRRFAYSGDSAPCLSLEEIGEGADLLLVECGYEADPSTRSDASRTPPAHHTPEDAGRTATAARASHLVLTHLADGLTAADATSRAAAHFTGPVDIAVRGALLDV
ncbi:MBL fold metallo-hydrolase [Herbiconiux sp. CPCC 203407]|uniref:MBL fold metallo-hydrolase n=1 Tax=Herbiconiux oxytropis TaxID=2970915 RepID=A0AA41XBR0_9MICO|nr:MBL fold metallo-hydrolase [Herbiconiux oxytropis]MCS5724041.1 MBL fold metallo-hydrolase [Herbiconiux oxytropis]MCS5725102.1 MBL fold metallo-hydrolase [Herbiconiux oxytropis]